MSPFPTESEILLMPKQKLPFHDHLLCCTKDRLYFRCICSGTKSPTSIFYSCTECRFSLHEECVKRFLNHPFRCNHFLKIPIGTTLTSSINMNKVYDRCHICRERLWFPIARCEICNISLSQRCLEEPPPLTIFQPKHHKHSLTLLLRLVTFTCNACGLEGDRNPYVCLECNLMIHKDCIELPRVISINRHDHRISHTFHIGHGDWECGVCRRTIDWVYGAFTCVRCPNYAVHSKCATRKEVWDGIELEDVAEEEEEIEDPFEVINETDIIHFSHKKHILRLDENCVMDMRCGGCILPINRDPCYKCVECDFSLHKACASLPRKKRHLLHNHKLILQVDKDETYECVACKTSSNGFRYECYLEDRCEVPHIYDVRCSSVSEPFHHDLHPHPLYWTLEGSKQCQACARSTRNPLRCMVCEYALCMKCATLPRKVKHRCDDHFLSLCQGAGNAIGDLWCDICETETNPSLRYYTCDECGLSLHIKCVLGDLYYTKVGHSNPENEILANNGSTRPLCGVCEVRCKFPFLIRKTIEDSVHYICSIKCNLHPIGYQKRYDFFSGKPKWKEVRISKR